MRCLPLLLICACLGAPAYGQALAPLPQGFDISGNVRLRFEAISGQARAGVRPDETSLQLRALILASYRRDRLTLAAELIDSRAFDVPDRTAISTNEVNALEPLQAWIAYDVGDPAASRWSGRITAGRMTLDLGSRRLVARDDYRNTLTSFTGVRVDVAAPDKIVGTFVYVLPTLRLPDDAAGIRANRIVFDPEGFETRLWGGRVFRPATIGRLGLEAAFLRFEERDTPTRPTRDRHLSNLELRLVAPPAPNKVELELNVIRQTGSIAPSLAPTLARQPVEAWYGHARIGYGWASPLHPRLALEADYATGNRPGSGRYGRFDSLFGQRRADYSPAGLYNAINRSNLILIGPRVDIAPSPRVDAFASVKKMWLDSARDGFATTGVVDPTGQSGRDAGWQIDGRVRYWVVPKRLQLSVDGTVIAKGRFLRTAPNRASAADTLFAALSATAFF